MEKNIYLTGKYAETHPSYHVEDSPWKAQQILKMIKKHNLQMYSVAEIGCGAGEILREMQNHLPIETTFYGYEISPQAFAMCEQKKNLKLHFSCDDILLKDTVSFDLLLCIDVFEHIEDYIGFLRKLRQKATNKIFHIPLDISMQNVLRCSPIISNRANFGHLHYFTKETALLTLKDAGYKTIDWFYTPSFIDRGKTLKAKLAKFPRKVFSLISSDLAVRTLGGYSLMVLAR
jgi:SAM-dependent methyltransferase